MGFTFVFRLQDETGASVAAIVRAYMITRAVLDLEYAWKEIEELGTKINAHKQVDMMMLYVRISRRVTRWFLRNRRLSLDINEALKLYSSGVKELKKAIPDVCGTKQKEEYDEMYNAHINDGVSPNLAHELTVTRGLFSAMDIIDIAHKKKMKIPKVAEVYFGIGEYLDLGWIRTQVIMHPIENNWESLSREALRDDLDLQQRQLADGLLGYDHESKELSAKLESWGQTHALLIERWRYILTDLKASSVLNYTMFFVAIRELLDLSQTTFQTYSKT